MRSVLLNWMAPGVEHLAEAEDRHLDGDRHVDQVVGEDRDVGARVAAHEEVLDADRHLVGEPVLGPAQDVEGVGVRLGEPAGGGERLDQRPAAGEGEIARRAHGADDQDRARARLAHLDRNRRAIDVLRLEQLLQLLREAGLGQPFGRHLADERQVDLAVLGHPDLDVQLRHFIDLDGDLVLGAEAVAHRRPGGQDLGCAGASPTQVASVASAASTASVAGSRRAQPGKPPPLRELGAEGACRRPHQNPRLYGHRGPLMGRPRREPRVDQYQVPWPKPKPRLARIWEIFWPGRPLPAGGVILDSW